MKDDEIVKGERYLLRYTNPNKRGEKIIATIVDVSISTYKIMYNGSSYWILKNEFCRKFDIIDVRI